MLPDILLMFNTHVDTYVQHNILKIQASTFKTDEITGVFAGRSTLGKLG